MLIPKFLSNGDIIGVTACSCGVKDKLNKYEKSIDNIKKYGFNIIETSNVRTSGKVSGTKENRAQELINLYLNDQVKLVAVASGGDFLYDMLSIIDYKVIRDNIKWICGSSDPTSLLFIITTNLDIATIYSPCNMSGFDRWPLHQSYVNYFKILKGELVKQERFLFKENGPFTDSFESENIWINLNGFVDVTGVLIGGCIECLKDVIGTFYDKTDLFLEKYKKDGFIWYFDIFSMTSEDLYKTLLQFSYAGWFKYTKVILIGKVCFPKTFTDTSYEEAIQMALSDIPIIYNFDVGHVKPSFTMINGLKCHVISNNKENSLEYIDVNS